MSLPNEFLADAGKHLEQVMRAAILMPVQIGDTRVDAVTRLAQSLWNSTFGPERCFEQASTVKFWELDDLLTALHCVGITGYLAVADEYVAARATMATEG